MAVKINPRLTSSTSVLGNNGNGRLALQPGQLNLYANRDKTPSGVTVAPAISGVDPFAFIPANSYAVIPGIDNYLDSAGTTAASVDGLVGRANDWGGLGPELVTNGGFDSDSWWSKEAGWSISGGVAVATNVIDGNYVYSTGAALGLVLGKTYLVTYTCLSYTSGQFRFNLGNTLGTTRSAVGTFSEILAPTNASYTFNGIRATGGGTTATFDNISVREVIGIHATQATTGNKPTLRRVDNLTYLQFDGTTDYLSLSAVPFQMADDHWVVACIKPATLTGVVGYFTARSAGTPCAPQIFTNGSTVYAGWGDDAANVAVSPSGYAITLGNTYVVTALKRGNDKSLRINGVQRAISSVAPGVTAASTQAFIGQAGAFYANANIYAVIYGKGTISDADLAAVERYAASLGGISI